jgi:hypothetical protein
VGAQNRSRRSPFFEVFAGRSTRGDRDEDAQHAGAEAMQDGRPAEGYTNADRAAGTADNDRFRAARPLQTDRFVTLDRPPQEALIIFAMT